MARIPLLMIYYNTLKQLNKDDIFRCYKFNFSLKNKHCAISVIYECRVTNSNAI